MGFVLAGDPANRSGGYPDERMEDGMKRGDRMGGAKKEKRGGRADKPVKKKAPFPAALRSSLTDSVCGPATPSSRAAL